MVSEKHDYDSDEQSKIKDANSNSNELIEEKVCYSSCVSNLETIFKYAEQNKLFEDQTLLDNFYLFKTAILNSKLNNLKQSCINDFFTNEK